MTREGVSNTRNRLAKTISVMLNTGHNPSELVVLRAPRKSLDRPVGRIQLGMRHHADRAVVIEKSEME